MANDDRIVWFTARAGEATPVPLEDVSDDYALYIPPGGEDQRCSACRVCHGAWIGDPPQGHACYPPMDPYLTWTNWGLGLK